MHLFPSRCGWCRAVREPPRNGRGPLRGLTLGAPGGGAPVSSAVIQSKLAMPPLGERLAARPRVSGLVAELLERHPLVLVTATAGAGKTTAVVQAAALLDRPTAWLTLDDTDAAPGRLLTYLEAAVARRAPAASDVATNALAARIPH